MSEAPPRQSRIYTAFKQATDGTHRRWDYVRGVSLDDLGDVQRFPLGRLTDGNNGPYIWTYAASDCVRP